MNPIESQDPEQAVAPVQRPTFWLIADRYEAAHESLALIEASLGQQLPDEERADLIRKRTAALSELDAIGQELVAKVDALCGVIRRIDADIEALKNRETRLHAKRKANEAAKDALEAYVKSTMVAQGFKFLKTQENTITLSGNGGLAPMTVNPALLEAEYQSVIVKMSMLDYSEAAVQFPDIKMVGQPEPNNQAIRAALAAGTLVEGAKIEDRGKHLRYT